MSPVYLPRQTGAHRGAIDNALKHDQTVSVELLGACRLTPTASSDHDPSW